MPDNNAPRSELPGGTVTFLFTDIEGSTKLLEQLRDQYANVLADQRDLLRAVFAQFNGYEVDTQGDAFFVAFARALDAVNCVVHAQRALNEHVWVQDVHVRVRMGLHTGEPVIARTGYVSMEVHRAQRIASAGYGGQVLLSQTVRDLIEHDLPQGVALRDLGLHKLKDFRALVPIYQLVMEGLQSEFPALKTLDREEEPPTPGDPPFKGLEFFDEADAENFFGRERVTLQLLEYVRQHRFLAVVGASGSGKSSVVRAGLIPALKRGTGDGDASSRTRDSIRNMRDDASGGQGTEERWRTFVITPTAHPLEALAVALTRDSESVTATVTLLDDLQDPRTLHLFFKRIMIERRAPLIPYPSALIPSHFLVMVDQFEELFTLCRDEQERVTFINNLLYAVNAEDGPMTVVLTLRADFYAALAPYAELRAAVAKHQEYIGPMTPDEMRRAIEEPALHGGWEFRPGLVDLILHDVGADPNGQPEPGALPLLSHALLETWKRRRGNVMLLKSYAESGGVRGAIAKTADRVFNQELDLGQQQIARNIFLRLTELGEGTADTRRRASLSELIPRTPYEQAQQTEIVLKHLADARLITTSQGDAQVAHEALIREWPQLREWLAQDREGLRFHRHLTEAAHEWELLERDPGALYRGTRLAQALDFVNAHPEQLNELEIAFAQASEENEKRETREREEQRERELLAAQKLAAEQQARIEESNRANKRLRQRALFLAGVVVFALIAAGAALYFLTQSNANLQTANEQHAEADLQRDNALKAQAQAEKEKRAATARELASAAIANLDVDPERSILLALQAVDATKKQDGIVLREAEEALHRAVETSRVVHTITGITKPNQVAYSTDGKQLAVRGKSVIKIFDAETANEQVSIPTTSGYSDVLPGMK